MTSSPRADPPAASAPRKRFDWRNFRIRALSAAILIPITLVVVWVGGWLYLLLLSVAIALLAVEWAGMSAPAARNRAAAVLLVAVLAPLFTGYMHSAAAAWIVMGATALAAALLSRGLGERAVDAAFGVIYLAPPALALWWLRSGSDGFGWTLLLLLVCWSADSAAFAGGNIFKGPRLWPRFSPNKTWSGFLTGLLAGAMVGAALTALHWSGVREVALGALIGLVTALAAMGGDLWESMLKRRFGVKDSGDLIPGHGGLLDRVDGLMFAALALAVVRLVVQGSVVQ